MKNSKGITMASLIIVITAIVLLSTMAIGFGYRYLTKTKQVNKEAFVEVLSSAVTKRESSYSVNMSSYPRLGFYIKDAETFKKLVEKYVPSLPHNSDLLYERGQWYIIDNITAEKLGVKDSSRFIDVYDMTGTEKITVALADYVSGSVILFTIDQEGIEEIKEGIDESKIEPTDGHIHDFNLPAATCTEDRKCLICGFVVQTALGHLYTNGAATPIDDEFHFRKTCERCGAKGGIERHTNLDKYTFYKSGDGTWYHYNGCSVCGWPEGARNYQRCDTYWESLSDTEHALRCKICEHSEVSNHTLKYIYVDKEYHEYLCTDCGFVKINFEVHEDTNNDHVCDKCDAEMITSDSPVLESVTLKNKNFPDSKYITKGETAVLTFKSDKAMQDAVVKIGGYGDEKLHYTYSADRYTCTVELTISEDIVLNQNEKLSISINCQSVSTGKWIVNPITATSDGSYLIFDSIPPTAEYILKGKY